MAFILEVSGDKEKDKAPALAARLTQSLDPATVKAASPIETAELTVTGIDISVGKEKLRDTLAGVGGCRSAEIRVGDTRTFRDGLGSAWVRCSTSAARKLIRARRVAVDWSMTRVETILKRSLQCYRCVELRHV